jgi:hypothetical protein
MKYLIAIILSAVCSTQLYAAAQVPLQCAPVDVSYQLGLKLDIFSKDKELLPQSYLTFSLCKIGLSATELQLNKPGTFRKAVSDYLMYLLKNDTVKFKTFFEDDKEELEQYEALISQFKVITKKENLRFENVVVNESIEDSNWAMFGINLKGKFGSLPFKAMFKRNAKGIIKVAIMKVPNPLVSELFTTFVMSNKPRVGMTQVPGHSLLLEKYTYKLKQPMIKFQFSPLSPESIHFKGIKSTFQKMSELAQKNNKKEFLKYVKSPESYQKDWGFHSDNKELLGLANYWKDLTPIAMIDLDPVYLVYLSDVNKSKIFHVYRFYKFGNKYLLLNEVLDLNQKLFTLSQIKEAALEDIPFESLRDTIK